MLQRRRHANASLEVRIPISPRPDYFNRIRLIAQSLREFYPDAIVRVTVGNESMPFVIEDVAPWSRELGVRWVWVSRDEFAEWRGTAHPYIATMMERFRPPFFAEHVLMIDADVMPIRPFDELFEGAPCLLSMMAHVTPFRYHEPDWRSLFVAYGLPAPSFERELSGWGVMETDPARRFSPPYFNTGVVLAQANVYERLYEPYMDALRFVRGQLNSYFFEQIALTLALAKAELPFRELPLRYNFPNQAAFDVANTEELTSVVLLHFLRTEIVHREKDFETPESIRDFVARRDLTGSNEALRHRVSALVAQW